MTRILCTLIAACVLAVVPVSDALAARHMSASVALRNANRAATKKAAQSHGAVVNWSISRGFRFTARKFVFVWWATMSDGKVCSAQLVTRYASSKTSKIVSYFRLETCS